LSPMMRVAISMFVLAIGCSDATFELADDSPAGVRTDSPAPDEALVESDSQVLDAASDTSDAQFDAWVSLPDTPDVRGEAADSWMPSPDTFASPVDSWVPPDTYVASDTAASPPDARVDIVFPALGDTWASKYGVGRLAVVGDRVTGGRMFSGGQTIGSATLQTDGDGIAAHQMMVALFIDGVKVGEDKAYPTTRPKYAFVLSSAFSSGVHVLEFRVTEVFSCVPLPDCSGGYYKVPNGVTIVRFE